MAYRTIAIVGTPNVQEFVANAAITPGHLCELMSTGKARVHATAGGTAERLFALEDDNLGGEIGTAYTAENVARFGYFRPGDQVFAILYDGETAVIGSKLESQGDGTLRVVDVDSAFSDIGINSIVGVALEAVDMSDSAAADPSPRIRIAIV